METVLLRTGLFIKLTHAQQHYCALQTTAHSDTPNNPTKLRRNRVATAIANYSVTRRQLHSIIINLQCSMLKGGKHILQQQIKIIVTILTHNIHNCI